MDFADGDAAADRFEQYKALDPFPDIPPALLNSGDIADYVSATGMISPFSPERLKTASYEVPLLGRLFYVEADGRTSEKDLKEGESFILPPKQYRLLVCRTLFSHS